MVNFCDNELIKLTFVSFEMAKKALPEYSCGKSKYTFSQPTHGINTFNEAFKI
jgi:hypothetical protein